jgi:hypothetical protein
MKRNRNGINFDLGMPLKSPEEFELLYVELYPEQKQRLIHWIEDEDEDSIIVAGQIGTGKTTLIEKAFRETAIKWDVHIKLDEEVALYVRGAFWGVFLGKVIALAQKKKCDTTPFGLAEDLLGIKPSADSLNQLVRALCDNPKTIADFHRKKKLYHLIDENIEIIQRQAGDIIKLVEKKMKRKLFVFAEGIDKFRPYTADYLSLLDLLDFLNRYKTLYEANLIHLFGKLQEWHKSKKIFLTGAAAGQITEILTKRLGLYSKAREKILAVLSSLCGGNLRQGLRLLIEYDYAADEMKKDAPQALNYACQRTRDDLLNVPGKTLEPEILKVVNKDKYIKSGTLTGFDTMPGALNAIYLNWILIINEAEQGVKWPASVNPLLLPALQILADLPEAPETKLLREWAEAHEISPFGLEIDVSNLDHPEKFFDILGLDEHPLMLLNILEIFDRMAAYFLNTDRKDKIIIAYENEELVKIANDFIIGKAGTYKPGNFKDIDYDDATGGQTDIFLNFLEKDRYDGYSIFFKRKLTAAELQVLDQRRDAFSDYKMIWWIRYDDEFDYLREHCQESSNEFTLKQLEEVLRCKILHPALHYHIKDQKIDIPHDIRIAAAARNPFLFLYQFSFQFLLIFGNSNKQQELNRLITIISEYKNKMTIPPGILFGI